MIKILFNGFRHGHINVLYKKVCESSVCEVAGCIEENEEARILAEENLGINFSEKSYEEWLKTDIDAVAIGDAYGRRGKEIILALKHGKHVITDKPVCITTEELSEIKSLCQKNNLKISCMLDLRYVPQMLLANEILKSGELGEVKNIAFNGQHCIDYANRPKWYFEEGMHGGTINDLAIHGIDLVRMFTGMEFTKVDAARVWNSYAYKNKDFKDCALFMARLSNGAGVIADVSYSAPKQVSPLPTYWEFRIWCEKGMISFCCADLAVTVYKEESSKRIESVENKTDYLDEFVKSIETNDNSITQNVLKSTETALYIQSVADKCSD